MASSFEYNDDPTPERKVVVLSFVPNERFVYQ